MISIRLRGLFHLRTKRGRGVPALGKWGVSGREGWKMQIC
jgi:hypothetical protein